MLTLTGTLRQSGQIKPKEGDPLLKIWVEHETPAQGDRPGDLEILEFMLPDGTEIPERGGEISVSVRSYVVGRQIRYQALEVVPGVPTQGRASKAVASK